jgi:hypothetical protein
LHLCICIYLQYLLILQLQSSRYPDSNLWYFNINLVAKDNIKIEKNQQANFIPMTSTNRIIGSTTVAPQPHWPGNIFCYINFSTFNTTAIPTQPPVARHCVGTSCGTLEVNIDYPGNDITSAITYDPQGCCNECTNYTGCVAYSWNIDGTCYSKSDKSFPMDSPGIHPAVIATSFCTFIENGIDYFGNNVGYVSFYNTASVEDCCISCRLQIFGICTWYQRLLL